MAEVNTNGGYKSGVVQTGEALDALLGKIKDATAATEDAAGTGGMIPAPPAGSSAKALFGNMTWQDVAKPSDIPAAVDTAALKQEIIDEVSGMIPTVDTTAMNHAKFLSNAPKTVTTLANLPTDTHNIIANVTAATNLSVASGLIDGRDLQIRVNNTTSSVITQTIPTTGNYDCLDGTSVEIPANGFIELNIWYINSKYVIRIGQKQ